MEIKKRRHHFVQKKFLEPWLVDGRVWTLLNRSRIEAMDPINVAVMRDFHSVGVYTEADINLLGSIAVTGTTGPRREQVTEMVDIVAHPSRKYRRMLDEHPEDPEAAEVYLHNAYEEFHSRVETSGEPFLAALRAGDLSFLKDFDSYLKFMFFLAVQSMRTRTNRARFSKQFHTINQRGDADCDRVWLGLAFVGGDKVAWNLAERHRDIRIELLHVKGSSHLVTADHPVVNLDHSFPEVPTKFRWYYPLTPTLAFLLTSDHPKGGTGHVGISDGRVAELNRKMANESLLQVFADSEAALMPLRVAAEARPRNQ